MLLLVGGLLMGAMTGESGTAPIKNVFLDPFEGVLALFLLELGLVAGGTAGRSTQFRPAHHRLCRSGATRVGSVRGRHRNGQRPEKLLVIIAEAALEKRLVSDVREAGAHGYTVHDVRSGSQYATREGTWEAD